MRLTLLAILVLLFSAVSLRADDPPASEPEQPKELHWAIKLGLRSHQVSQAYPLVDRVVLVPDAATYLDELGKWSPRGRWPVLFDEPQFAPMFIRRFKPAEVIRRESVGELPEDKSARELLLERTIVTSWGGNPAANTPEHVFAANKFTPAGVVVTSVDDPAWTAAVALAAGHGQPILFVDGKFGEDRGIMNANLLERFTKRFDEELSKLPYAWNALGDDIDAITVCRDVAARTRMTLPNATAPENLAFTDILGRDENGTRWAFTGWIFGSESRSAYVAMCSLFLDRTQTLLVNTYPNEGQWATYGLSQVELALKSIGFDTVLHEGPAARADAWQRMLPGGITADVVLFNSRGMQEFFEMAEGRAYALDVPMLDTPAAVHLIHSFSMAFPQDRTTVAGRWIDHGAYAFVGSVAEPSLGGFVPPMLVAERLVNFVPMLVAARHWDGYRAGIGKIATYGDPLMLITRPEKAKHPRIEVECEYGVNMEELARKELEEIKTTPTAELYAATIANLVMLGKDEIAAELWMHAQQHGIAGAAADRALGALFRLRKTNEFMQAWDAMLTRTDADVDMLWHLWSAQLGHVDKDALLQLQSAIRAGQPEIDLERLLPGLERHFDEAHVQRVIDREIDKADNERTRKQLRELRRHN